MRFFVPAAVCAAILLGVVGCGSSNDAAGTTAAASTAATNPLPTGTTTAKTSTASLNADHKAFLKRVNPICADYNRDVRKVQKELVKQEKEAGRAVGNVDAYVGPLKRATAVAQRAADRFNALDPPAAEASEAALIGRALQAQAKGNDLLLQAARSDDPQAFGVATEALKQVTPQLQSLMRAYGMTVCGARS